MDELKLRNKDLPPCGDVLEQILADNYPVYILFGELIAPYGIEPEWRYYNDGNAWQCKLMLKKKNLGWLHVYDGYFTVTCFFLERHFPSFATLDIPPEVKQATFDGQTSGKLRPMAIRVENSEAAEQAVRMLLFKSTLK